MSLIRKSIDDKYCSFPHKRWPMYFYRTQVSLGSGLWFSVSLSLSVWDLWLKLCLWWYQLNRIDDANIKQFVINAMYASTSWIFLNTQKQLRGQREKTMSTMLTQHASAVRMIWVWTQYPGSVVPLAMFYYVLHEKKLNKIFFCGMS